MDHPHSTREHVSYETICRRTNEVKRMSSDRPFTFPMRRRSRALAGMLAGALLIAACSQDTPEPTATPVPTEPPTAVEVAVATSTPIPTAEVTAESVLGPIETTAIP